MKTIKLLVLVFLPLWANAQAVAFEIAEKDLVPEGICHDSRTGTFYISSVHKKKIVAVDKAGKTTDFIAEGQDGFQGGVGVKVDADRNVLWACSAVAKGAGYIASVYSFDLKTGVLKQSWYPADSGFYLFNDLAIARNGDAFVTDTWNNAVYVIRHESKKLELFLKSPELLYPNGIVLSPDESKLYVATDQDIKVISLKNLSVAPLSNPANADMRGIDGLSWYRNSLIGVQNYDTAHVNQKVTRYTLSANGNSVIKQVVIDKGHSEFAEPTTCVVVGNDLFVIANSFLGIYRGGIFLRPEQLRYTKIIRYRL